jgi:hypothetical protein
MIFFLLKMFMAKVFLVFVSLYTISIESESDSFVIR